jgi:hypothetical protein
MKLVDGFQSSKRAPFMPHKTQGQILISSTRAPHLPDARFVWSEVKIVETHDEAITHVGTFRK